MNNKNFIFLILYCFMFSFSSSMEVKPETISRLIRIPVKSQLDSNGGGSASCGYHALKNGLIIEQSLIIGNGELNDQVLQKLTDTNIIEKLFSFNNSLWRSIVIKYRALQLAQYYIYDQLLKNIKEAQVKDISYKNGYSLKLENNKIAFGSPANFLFSLFRKSNDYKEQKAFANILVDAAKYLAFTTSTYGYEEDKHTYTYNLNVQTIFDALSTVLNKKVQRQSPEIYQALNNFDVFCTYFPNLVDKQILFDVVNDNTVQAYEIGSSQESFKEYFYDWQEHKSCSKVTSNIGEWISGEEIDEIIKHERRYPSSLLKFEHSQSGINLPDNLYDNNVYFIEDLDRNPLSEQILIAPELNKLYQELEKPDSSLIAILIIHKSNHWFSCVINKQKNKFTYILADSLNSNLSLTREKYVKRIVASLTQSEIAEITEIDAVCQKEEPKLEITCQKEHEGTIRARNCKLARQFYTDSMLPISIYFNKRYPIIIEHTIEMLKK